MFDKQWEEIAGAVKRRCLSLAKNLDAANDLYSGTYLKARKGFKGYNGKAAFKTWVMTIARNAWIDTCRQRKMLPLTAAEEIESPDMMNFGEVSAAIAVLEKELPAHYWSILQLIYIDRLSYQEAADLFEVPIGTIKSRINRARIAAKKLLS